MKNILIMTDSHSGIANDEAQKLGIKVIPMPFSVNGQECLEGKDVSTKEFIERLRQGVDVSTSQPAPGLITDAFEEALKEYDEVVYIPISSGLSGSYNTAKMLSTDEAFEGKVFVVDNGRVSTPQHRSVLDAIELKEEGYSAADICEMLEENAGNMGIYVAVDTMEYLKKGGRVSAASAAIAGALNIKPVLYFDTGLLTVVKKSRGMKKARKEMLDCLQSDLETKYKEWYDNDEVYILVASSADEAVTAEWVEEVKERFPGKDVLADPLAMGVACHIGPDGLGVACACKPKRK